jgi:hypothetical protein
MHWFLIFIFSFACMASSQSMATDTLANTTQIAPRIKVAEGINTIYPPNYRFPDSSDLRNLQQTYTGIVLGLRFHSPFFQLHYKKSESLETSTHAFYREFMEIAQMFQAAVLPTFPGVKSYLDTAMEVLTLANVQSDTVAVLVLDMAYDRFALDYRDREKFGRPLTWQDYFFCITIPPVQITEGQLLHLRFSDKFVMTNVKKNFVKVQVLVHTEFYEFPWNSVATIRIEDKSAPLYFRFFTDDGWELFSHIEVSVL